MNDFTTIATKELEALKKQADAARILVNFLQKELRECPDWKAAKVVLDAYKKKVGE